MSAAEKCEVRTDDERRQWFVALDFGVANAEAVAPEPPARDVLP